MTATNFYLRFWRLISWTLMPFAAWSFAVRAEDNLSLADFAERAPTVTVPPRQSEIVIDGELAANEWSGAVSIAGDRPALNRDEARYPFTVKLQYDGDYLYVAFICPGEELKPFGEKNDDWLYKGDAAEIFIDGAGDARQFFEIEFNAENLVCDLEHTYSAPTVKFNADGFYAEMDYRADELAYNLANLKSAAKILRGENGAVSGWQIEAALPAPELLRRLPADHRELRAGQKLRANFIRMQYSGDNADTEKNLHCSYWSPTMFGCPHISPSLMGTLILGE